MTGTSEFLGADDFVGTWEGRGWWPPFIGHSKFAGWMVFANASRSVIGSALPPELALAEPKSGTAQHPVVLLFGEQDDLEIALPDGGGINVYDPYRELMLLVPFVVEKGSDCQCWHTLVIRMYLDDAVAVMGGKHFGYQKLLATLGTTVSTFEVTLPPAFKATLTNSGVWKPANSADFPNLPMMRQILEMPILGLDGSLGQKYVCSYWGWHHQGTELQKSSATFSFESGFTPTNPWTSLGTMTSVSDGALRVRKLTWRLSSPDSCRF